MVTLSHHDHEVGVKRDLRELMTNESYWNVIIFCKDGALAHNRLIIGLIFPQLSDEISVVCPDHSLQDIHDLVSETLDTGHHGGETRDRFVLSHVMDTDNNVFQPASTNDNEMFQPASNDNDMFQPTDNAWDNADEEDNITEDASEGRHTPEDPLNTDDDTMETNDNDRPDSSDTHTDPLITSSCDIDSKTNLLVHLDALGKKSPRKSPKKRIKLRKAAELVDKKPIVEDGNTTTASVHLDRQMTAVKNLLDDLVDRVEKDESQPRNLVFSTLGQTDRNDDIEEDNNVDDDDISAYLESSRETTPEPFAQAQDDYNEMSSDFEMTPTKLRPCKVGVERLMVSEEEKAFMKKIIDKKNKDKKKTKLIRESRNLLGGRKLLRDRSKIGKSDEGVKKKKTFVNKLKRKVKRCFSCESCQLPDCRKCIFCKDMKKYGGKGVKKQSCVMRPKCLFLVNNKIKLKSKPKVPSTSIPSSTVETTDKSNVGPTKTSSGGPKKIIKKKKKKLKRKENNNVEKLETRKIDTSSQEEITLDKTNVKEIREALKSQEKVSSNGTKVNKLNLSREELLFGFYL